MRKNQNLPLTVSMLITTATTTAQTMNLNIFVSQILIDYSRNRFTDWFIGTSNASFIVADHSLLFANLLVFPKKFVRVNIDLINRNTTYLLELNFKRHYHENSGQLSYKSLQDQLFLQINLSKWHGRTHGEYFGTPKHI